MLQASLIKGATKKKGAFEYSKKISDIRINDMTLLSIEIWGRAGWTLIHASSFAYPEEPTPEERKGMFDFLWSLTVVLPCQKCRSHLREYLSSSLTSVDSEHLDSKQSISFYLWTLHNSVNERIQKDKISYEEVCDRYKVPPGSICSTSPKENTCAKNAIFFFVFGIVIAGTVMCVFSRLLRCKILGKCDF